MVRKYLISHRSPDTDTICSAIVYGNFLRRKFGYDVEVCRLGDLNNETKFVLERFNLEVPNLVTELEEGSEIILMDHNEAKQSINNIENYKIVQIIDHHKFNLTTKDPLFIRAEPIGSTCSIVAKMFFENGMEISKNEAGALISAIISDTLYFRSPTTTKEDIDLVKKLNEIVGIDDLERYSLELFDRKSDLGDISVEELIRMDYKEFNLNGKKIGIGVMETTNPNFALSRKDEIVSKLKEIKENDGLDLVFLSIIDILEERNITIYPDEESNRILAKAFSVDLGSNGLIDLKRIISRKKQIVPKLEETW